MEDKATKQRYLIHLVQIFTDRFNEGELRTLCFRLDTDYDGLPGNSKVDKARELVQYFDRLDSLADLVDVGRQMRPKAPWNGEPAAEEGSTVPFHRVDKTPVRISVQVSGEGNTVITGGGDVNR